MEHQAKTFIVDRLEFQKEFLDPLVTFKSSDEFIPIHYHNGKLTTVCSLQVKNNKGLIGLCIEYTPESCTMTEGDIFYVREPVKLKKSLGIVTSDRMAFEVTPSHLRSVGDDYIYTSRLYDPMLAARNNTFWDPKKFDTLREGFRDGVKLDIDFIKRIKSSGHNTSSDFAHIIVGEHKTSIRIGDNQDESMQLDMPSHGSFKRDFKFNKTLFSVVGRYESELSETADGRIVVITERTERTNRFCIITKAL